MLFPCPPWHHSASQCSTELVKEVCGSVPVLQLRSRKQRSMCETVSGTEHPASQQTIANELRWDDLRAQWRCLLVTHGLYLCLWPSTTGGYSCCLPVVLLKASRQSLGALSVGGFLIPAVRPVEMQFQNSQFHSSLIFFLHRSLCLACGWISWHW